MDGILFAAFVYLCAAVIAVPVAKRLGLGSVLGYLIAGIVIGPVTHLVGSETQEVRHFAEFGVVMMLFLVGLELQPRKLWQMRTLLMGLGGLQVFATAIVIAAGGWLLGLDGGVALTVGMIFALSSTAIVLQTLGEKGLMQTEGGKSAIAVLLFQDMAVIPMLALIPLLAQPELVADPHRGVPASGQHDMSLVAGLPGWVYALVVLGAVVAVVLTGHFLTRPLFRFIAAARLREIFTATALLLVIGIALLMSLVDLSPALGTFLAGVVLADSEFRHELETDIEPFKGLLLGLFFITVGAGMDFAVLASQFWTIAGLTLAVVAVKSLLLYGLGHLFRLGSGDRSLFALGLAQAGEFGFVLLAFSVQNAVLTAELAQSLTLVVALSMLLTPALFIVHERLVLPRLREGETRPPDQIEEQGTVIIAGIGRFGQIVNRLLLAAGVRTVVLDHEATQIDRMRRLGIRSWYGDTTRLDLLEAAGIDKADALVVAIDDRDRAVQMVAAVRRAYPELRILARAFDVNHLYLLKKAGADLAVRELFEASLEVAGDCLCGLGWHPFKVEKMMRAFRRHDAEGLDELYGLWDENLELSRNHALMAGVRARTETLPDVLFADRLQLHDRTERGWTPPPKGYDQGAGGSSDTADR
jgi:CPA2 family monovalent cation:H+ antiporter-2